MRRAAASSPAVQCRKPTREVSSPGTAVRDLWKASGHRAGSPKRSVWKDIRGAVYGLLFLLLLAVVGVYFVTVVIGEYVGGDGDVPGISDSPSPPT